MVRILVVDDERLLVKGLKRSLEDAGFAVAVAYDGALALEIIEQGGVDLVVLDLMLPELDGFEVCRRVRKFSNLPIIMLTARGDDVDKIVGLELGADDYLAKPFNTRELMARIKAVLRRSGDASVSGASPSGGSGNPTGRPGNVSTANNKHADGSAGPPAGNRPPAVISSGGLMVDPERQIVTIEEQEVELTAREFELLYTLARHPGRVFTREMLLEQVWGTHYYGEPRVVDVYIRRLRQKIERDPANPRWVVTRWGAGYLFREQG